MLYFQQVSQAANKGLNAIKFIATTHSHPN